MRKQLALRASGAAMIKIVTAFDRAPLAELERDDAASLETKLATATRLFADRDSWLKPFQRIEILRKLAVLMERCESEPKWDPATD